MLQRTDAELLDQSQRIVLRIVKQNTDRIAALKQFTLEQAAPTTVK